MGYNNKEYWYFRLVKTTFNDDEIRYLKKLPDGYKHVVIYLEICCLSVKDGGFVRIPRTSPLASFAADLALDLEEREGDVVKALKYLTELNLIEIIETVDQLEAVLKIPKVINNTGRSTKYADYKRAERRELDSSDINLLPKTNEEKRYGKHDNVFLTEEEYSSISSDEKYRNMIVNALSELKKMQSSNGEKSDYESCMEIAEKVRN